MANVLTSLPPQSVSPRSLGYLQSGELHGRSDLIMRKLLYICVNDGSDMRINREVRTLSREHDIVFLAIGEKRADSFVEGYCRETHYVQGSHKSPKTIARMIARLISILSKNSFANVHIVNEQLYLAILPILDRRR